MQISEITQKHIESFDKVAFNALFPNEDYQQCKEVYSSFWDVAVSKPEYIEQAKILLDKNALIFLQRAELVHACECMQTDTLEVLLQHMQKTLPFCDTTRIEKTAHAIQQTAEFLVKSYSKNPERYQACLKLFLRYPIDNIHFDAYNWTLYHAVFRQKTEVIQMLLENRIDQGSLKAIKGVFGTDLTYFMLASESETIYCQEIFALLLEAGCDFFEKNKQGQNILEYAATLPYNALVVEFVFNIPVTYRKAIWTNDVTHGNEKEESKTKDFDVTDDGLWNKYCFSKLFQNKEKAEILGGLLRQVVDSAAEVAEKKNCFHSDLINKIRMMEVLLQEGANKYVGGELSIDYMLSFWIQRLHEDEAHLKGRKFRSLFSHSLTSIEKKLSVANQVLKSLIHRYDFTPHKDVVNLPFWETLEERTSQKNPAIEALRNLSLHSGETMSLEAFRQALKGISMNVVTEEAKDKQAEKTQKFFHQLTEKFYESRIQQLVFNLTNHSVIEDDEIYLSRMSPFG